MTRKIIVGGSLRDAVSRVADAWHRAERGEIVETRDTVTFVSWSALASVMTDKRLELLRHLHEHPVTSIRGLARSLGRDFKRVHEDVTALLGIGLITQGDGLYRVDWDEISTSIMVAKAA